MQLTKDGKVISSGKGMDGLTRSWGSLSKLWESTVRQMAAKVNAANPRKR